MIYYLFQVIVRDLCQGFYGNSMASKQSQIIVSISFLQNLYDGIL